MSILREKLTNDLIGLFAVSLDHMSDKELEKLHKETFTELGDRIEQSILFGEENEKC